MLDNEMNLQHLKALCEKATQGEWKLGQPFDNVAYIGIMSEEGYNFSARTNDAEFIAACNPETILKLLSIIEIQRKALEYIKSDHVFQGKAVAKNGYQCRNRAREALTAVDGMLGE
jgi:hypothetical protein